MAMAMAMLGSWMRPQGRPPAFAASELGDVIAEIRRPAYVVRESPQGRVGLALDGQVSPEPAAGSDRLPLMGILPALYPEWLGDRSFNEVHGVRFPYVVGEMANGIATTQMVTALARAELLGFFGAAGLPLAEVDHAITTLASELVAGGAWGVNLIHSPAEPELEEAVSDLLIRRNVPIVSASAFMSLTPAVVRCAAAGLRVDPAGRIVRARQLFAKVSRPEVAVHFMSPPPAPALRALVGRGLLTETEATLAAQLPVAEDITVEADSAGHTDNRPLVAVLPALLMLRNQLCARYKYDRPVRIGAAGGICTPGSVAAAFALGAAYVLTGSINQATVESGLSAAGKELLAKADLADVAMAPSADMFELGVRVQVLKRGTLFASRAARLYEAYVRYESLDAIPAGERRRIESEILHASLAQAWASTEHFWRTRDASQLGRAERDPKHKMALLFRSYLGLSSKWAITGEAERLSDFQIWCGPAMGAFNRWTEGSFLAAPAERGVVQIALNLLEGAAVFTRAQQARNYGAAVPAEAFNFVPRRLA